MALREKKSKFAIPLYEAEVTLYFSSHPNLTKERICKDGEKEAIVNDATYNDWFIHYKPDNKTYILVLPFKADVSTISHESLHITAQLLRTSGMMLTIASEEAYAYLIGFIAKKIESRRKRANKKT